MSSLMKKASNSEGGNYEHPESGMHVAYTIAVVDLGTHSYTFVDKVKGPQTKDAQKVQFAWELTDSKDKDGRTFIVGRDFTLSMGKKANLRPFTEGWTGLKFNDEDPFDPMDQLGKPCMINLSEGKSAKGSKFMEVISASPPMRGMAIPKPTRSTFGFEMSSLNGVADLFLPDWLPRIYGEPTRDVIKKSQEWAQLEHLESKTVVANLLDGDSEPAF